MNNDDSEQIRRLRNRAMLDNYNNPLIEWTLSSEWTEAPRVVDWKGDRLARGHKVPGITRNEVTGEIECKITGPTYTWAVHECR